MNNAEIEQLVFSLKTQVGNLKNFNEPMDASDWGQQEGVLLTGQQAEGVLNLLESAVSNEDQPKALDGFDVHNGEDGCLMVVSKVS